LAAVSSRLVGKLILHVTEEITIIGFIKIIFVIDAELHYEDKVAGKTDTMILN
jgi:hypothetical protein